MKIFIVYWHDRHVDAAITAHRTRERADADIERHKSYYGAGYEWAEKDYGRDIGWVRYVSSNGGDGPNGRIIESELED